jgi:hypothetical protein
MNYLTKYLLIVFLVSIGINSFAQPAFVSVTSDSVSYRGGCDGKINITITGGTAPYKYYLLNLELPSFNIQSAISSDLTFTFDSLKASMDYEVRVKDNSGAGVKVKYLGSVKVEEPSLEKSGKR